MISPYVFFILNSFLATARDITIIVVVALFILVLLAGALLGVVIYFKASRVIKRADNIAKHAEQTVNTGEQMSKAMRFATHAFTRGLRFESRFRSRKDGDQHKRKDEEKPVDK